MSVGINESPYFQGFSAINYSIVNFVVKGTYNTLEKIRRWSLMPFQVYNSSKNRILVYKYGFKNILNDRISKTYIQIT